MATKKEISWEFIRETNGKKYFLAKKSEKEFFVFRTPKNTAEKSKLDYTLENWEGEIAAWGSTPAKVRNLLLRKKVGPDPKKQEILIPQT